MTTHDPYENVSDISKVRLHIKEDFANGEYGKYRQMGELAKLFTEMGVLFEVGVGGNSRFDQKHRGYPRISCITITTCPMGSMPDKVHVFEFAPDYEFDCQYIENSEPLGFRTGEET